MEPSLTRRAQNRGRKRQVIVCCLVNILAFIYGMLQTWLSLAIKRLQEGVAGFPVTQVEISIICSMLTLGMFLTPIVFGFILVKIGRKTNLILGAALYTVAWALIIFASSPIWLMAANLSGGLGCGTVLIIGPIYIAEIADKRIRGSLITFFTAVFAIGAVFQTSVGIFISYLTLNVIGLALAVVAFLSISFCATESPSWHMMCNEDEKAERSFKYYWNANLDAEESQTAALNQLKRTVDAEMRSTCSYLELFRTPSNVKASIIVIVLSLLQATSGIAAISTYASTTLPKYDGFWQPNPTMAFVNLLNLTFNFIGMGLIDRWGRRPLSILSNFGDALGTGIIALYFFIDEYTSWDTTNIKWLPYIGVLTYILFFGVAMTSLPHILVGELFPANVRYHASVVSVCCIAGAVAILNFIYLHVSNLVGVWMMFLIFTVFSIVATVFSWCYMFETKNLTLAEIQLKMQG